MDAQRVLDRRPIWTARQWDGSQEVLDWIRPGLDQGLLTYGEDGVLSQWGSPVPDGAWLIFRDGWFDIQPTTQAYEARYEPAPASAPAGTTPEQVQTPPPSDQPPADEPPADEPPADEPPADQPPADQPPADQPPADEPPGEQPSGEETPADDTPNNQEPA
jgi:hypothetical protein